MAKPAAAHKRKMYGSFIVLMWHNPLLHVRPDTSISHKYYINSQCQIMLKTAWYTLESIGNCLFYLCLVLSYYNLPQPIVTSLLCIPMQGESIGKHYKQLISNEWIKKKVIYLIVSNRSQWDGICLTSKTLIMMIITQILKQSEHVRYIYTEQW